MTASTSTTHGTADTTPRPEAAAPALGGLHHLTAVTADATANLRLATQTLGLRLVKKTVNQDDVSAYHLFYGDALGRAGTELTFFDWARARRRQPGFGEVAETGLRVPSVEALTWWTQRFANDPSVRIVGEAERAGRPVVRFTDLEGQPFALVADPDTPLPPAPNDPELASAEAEWWAEAAPVPREMAIRGLGPVLLHTARPQWTARFLRDVMGMREAGQYADPDDRAREVLVFAMGPGGAAAEVHVVARPDLGMAQGGAGGVHHVAFRVADRETQRAWLDHLSALGVRSSGLVERYYFQSLYFREPNGTLFELATDGPGFTTDEDVRRLGESLALPPFLEPDRAAIEAGLTPLPSVAELARNG